MRMVILAFLGAGSLALGVLLVGAGVYFNDIDGVMIDVVTRGAIVMLGVAIALVGAITLALGKIYEVLVEIRDK